jgi:hypothetical protein
MAAVMLVACGGKSHRATPPQPKLPRALAQQLAAASDDVARKLDAGDSCGALASAQALQQQTIAAINARQVPPALQETLLGAVNGLPPQIQCTSSDGQGNGNGKGKGHGKHAGEGD